MATCYKNVPQKRHTRRRLLEPRAVLLALEMEA